MSSLPALDCVLVVGTGLMGTSVGLALRAHGVDVHLLDRDPAVAEMAAAFGAGQVAGPDTPQADLAVIGAPPRAVPGILADLQKRGAARAYTDVASTKSGLQQALARAGADPATFVGGHPLAGSEAAGAEHARADLFEGATWYLTPTPRTAGLRLEALHRIVAGLGARPAVIEAPAHDRVMAAVSHLPHVLANVLVAAAQEALGGEGLPATGPSFRDATRVAGANPALWSQIYAANSDALAAEIDAAVARLQDVRARLVAGKDLRGWQEDAARRRPAGGREDTELRIVVPNRPGVVADVALTLAREGINIGDMALSPSPDMATGALTLWVEASRAPRAAEVLEGLGLAVG